MQVKAERGGGVYEVPKNEIAVALAASKEAELANISEWLLNTACSTSFRLLVALHFLLDLESKLTIASETLQKHSHALSDVIFVSSYWIDLLECSKSRMRLLCRVSPICTTQKQRLPKG